MTNTRTDTQDDYVQFVDEPDDVTPDEYAGGSTPERYSLPDDSPRVEVIQTLATAIAGALEKERSNFEAVKKSAVRVTTNLSGQVSFARFSVNTQAIQIVREKDLRGDITVVNYSDTDSIFIGLHAGIMHHGTDTVEVRPGASRVIRTRNALWSIAMVSAVDIDVQEEFD